MICARTSASTMKASRSSCISSIRCTACAGACRACSMKCTPAADPPTKDDGSWWRPGACRRRATAHANTSHERIMPNRRTMTVIALAGLMLLLGPEPGQTEDYPSRPVRLIITTPAGSLVDVLGRLLAQDLSDRLGQTIVVDNRPGAMTQIRADALNRASPDGYTLMIATSEATMLPFLKRSYHYDPVKDFTRLPSSPPPGPYSRSIRKCRPTRLPSSSPIPKPIRGGCATAAVASGARFTSPSRCCD